MQVQRINSRPVSLQQRKKGDSIAPVPAEINQEVAASNTLTRRALCS